MERLLKIWVVIISFISIVPLFLMAQNSPKDYLKAHNKARAEVGVEPLKWDPQLASYARKFVRKHILDCKKAISDSSFASNKYGQNIVYRAGSISGVDAVAMWLTHKTNCDDKSESCIDGTFTPRFRTLIIWRATTSLGCARAKCRNYGGILVTCFYDFAEHFRRFIIPLPN